LHNNRDGPTLPSDVLYTCTDAFVFIDTPKTKRFARRQHSRSGDPSIVALLEVVYGKSPREAPLWPFSKHQYRSCWNAILKALGVPFTVAAGGPTPGSLRGSGATDLYINHMGITDIQWLGRWLRL